MIVIWAEWKNGSVEEIDSADSESEAVHLVNEYRMAYGNSISRIWMQGR